MGLSKEEKKAKKEAARLEKLRQEMEVKKQMRREELVREMAAQASKRDELDRGWREMMLKIKEPVFKQDIKVMWHTFERAYDKKDYLTRHIMKLIDIANDQFQRALCSFCDTVDVMINKFLLDLEEMAKDNDNRTAALLKWAEDIRNRLMTEHNAAELHLHLLLYHGKTSSENFLWNTRGENMVKEDEEQSKCMDIREHLKSVLENIYNTMWEEYKATLKEYVTGTAENQKQVRRLRRKENIMADIIASQAKRIANSDDILRRLQSELSKYETGTKQAEFRDRRDRHRAASFRLKRRLLVGCATDERRLLTLVKASDNALEWIAKAQKKGLKIIRLAALCRKFETRREKVLPFGSDIPPEAPQGKSNVRRQQSDDSLLSLSMGTTLNAHPGLLRLWQRISRAELGKRALYREKAILERENEMLSLQLEGFDDLDFTGDTVKRTVLCQKRTTGKDHPVAIDGALALKKYRAHK